MKRIMVIGCPGSGKSTFSRALHSITKIPLFHLDRMNWNADRTVVERSVFHERLSKTIQNSEWIIDGNYGSTMELRLTACDTVFFLDYPVEICLDGVRERKGKARNDMPWVENIGEEDAEFIDFIKNYRLESRPKVMALLEKYSDRGIYIFENRGQAKAYLNQLQRQHSV